MLLLLRPRGGLNRRVAGQRLSGVYVDALSMQPGAGGENDEPHQPCDQRQVEEHLKGDEDPCSDRGRGDVAKADGRDGGDRVVHGIDPVEVLGEARRVGARESQVGEGEHDDQQGQRKGDDLDRTQHRMLGSHNRVELPTDQADEDKQAADHAEKSCRTRASRHRHERVEDEHPQRRGEDAEPRARDQASPLPGVPWQYALTHAEVAKLRSMTHG